MDKDLQSYVKVFKNWLDLDQCKNAVLELQNINWERHNFISYDRKPIDKNKENELDFSFDSILSNEYIMQRMWDCYKKYIEDLSFSWYDGWAGFSQVRYNRYAENTLFAEHCDHIHDLFSGEKRGIPVLSCVSLLNDEFDGGEFVMWEDKVIQLKAGDMMIFPSIFLYPHKVNPVKSGVRYSCVSWAW